ncbi:MAG: 8-oxo-dGTP diphosphatase MutT [Pseudomonadota bacterium]|nr:8-oxo-dGTP diphosphatase MutT [Pseudomonadota bacterium]
MIHVVAGALFDEQGRVLIAQRPPGKHMEGGWEFPGGKREAGEQPLDTLKRELQEELGVEVLDAEPLIAYQHEYPNSRVLLLDLWLVSLYTGEPRSVEGQPLQWVMIDELEAVGLLEADRPMIPALRAARR